MIECWSLTRFISAQSERLTTNVKRNVEKAKLVSIVKLFAKLSHFCLYLTDQLLSCILVYDNNLLKYFYIVISYYFNADIPSVIGAYRFKLFIVLPGVAAVQTL